MDLSILKNGLIVSCQAHGNHPLRNASIMASLAVCAELGGAVGIRADSPEDIQLIRANVSLPIIGIYKVPLTEERFFITPTFDHARQIVDAGASIVALEATFDNQPDDQKLTELIQRIQQELHVPVMADISTFEEGQRAWQIGAEFVGSTLSGYTSQTQKRETPDLDLVKKLADAGIRVIAEGHVRTPEQVKTLLAHGAFSVVVGTAITDPISITSWFVRAASSKE
jgi:N-acylglucosamine-6-phosphate 2-epimerase